jgi:Uma2 family endonuclease
MTVEAGESDYEPDCVVRCGEPLLGDAIAIPAPSVIVEVLLPSTRYVDLKRKMAGYFQLPSLRHYLIFWAEVPRVVHHRRDTAEADIRTCIVTTRPIVLDPPGVTITVEEVYLGQPT